VFRLWRNDTRGFPRARDLVKHLVSSHKLYPKDVQQGHEYACDGSDLRDATSEEMIRYGDGSDRCKRKLEEAAKAQE